MYSDEIDFLEVKLPNGQITLISKQDEHLIEVFPYHNVYGNYFRISRYVKTEYGKAKEEYYFHRLIMEFPKGFDIDHINRNKLDNRRTNLRLCSRGENNMNKSKALGLTSKYRGVSYRPKSNSKNPWVAYISKKGVRYELGYFKDENSAALAYNEKAKELWKDFAFQNEII